MLTNRIETVYSRIINKTTKINETYALKPRVSHSLTSWSILESTVECQRQSLLLIERSTGLRLSITIQSDLELRAWELHLVSSIARGCTTLLACV